MFPEAFPLPQEQGGTIPPDQLRSVGFQSVDVSTIRRSRPLFNRNLLIEPRPLTAAPCREQTFRRIRQLVFLAERPPCRRALRGLCRLHTGGDRMHHFAAVAASLVLPTITGKEAVQFILRWFHFIAGILWIGLLYFFNLVNVPFMKQVDASWKPKIFEHMTLPALNWFRWSALVTVFVGFWYWG